jgi:hypothetical protein
MPRLDVLVAEVDSDAGADIDLDRAFASGDAVAFCRWDLGEVVGAVFVTGGGARDAEGAILEGDGDSSHGSTGNVVNAAVDHGVLGSCKCGSRDSQREPEHQSGCSIRRT